MRATPLVKPQPNTHAGQGIPSDLKETIKTEAVRLGFLAVGITSADSFKNREADLAAWLRAGSAGPLHYMETFFERQARFLSGFSDLESIIVLAASYTQHTTSDPPQEPSGRVAWYAAGRNYHKTLEKHLKQLEFFIHAQIPAGNSVRIRRAVDTCPIQERALAEAAGLGFFGKNTCLIRPKGGSLFFLSTLLTNLKLQPDSPIHWDCGHCTLCMEACPTDALRKPHHLDANRCISTLTVESRGPINTELRPRLQDWLFGCDICQEVCPYNHSTASQSTWPELESQAGHGTRIPLALVLALRTQEDFLRTFAGTSLTRAGREGLLRNAAVVAGNLKDPDLVPELANALLNDRSAIVRQHSAWALGRIGTQASHEALTSALGIEQSPAVSSEIRSALGNP